jgi:hypothetical protein
MPTVWVGQGTTLTIATVVTVQVTEISGPELAVGAKDKTNLADVAIRMRPQLPSGGTISFTIQYDPTSTVHQALTTLVVSWPQALSACILTWTSTASHTWTFNAFITKFAPKGMNEEDNLEADLEMTIDGVPVIA